MRKALIAWGGWEGHEPEAGARRVGAMLAEEGFAVTTVNGTAAFGDPGLDGFSLIVPILTMSKIGRRSWPTSLAAVRGGVGLGGVSRRDGGRLPRTSRTTSSWWAANGLRIRGTSSTTGST